MSKTIIGTMSGTSVDGVDVAVLLTDGEDIAKPGPTFMRSYSKSEKKVILAAMEAVSKASDTELAIVKEAEDLVTKAHDEAVRRLMEDANLSPDDVDFVGLHGQTLFHAPQQGTTVQIGDGPALAKSLNIPVCYDFRSADLAAGGQGAPLVPIYHQAILKTKAVDEPAAIVNIGGIANVTIVSGDDLIAFDTGPGNALIDDWMKSRTSRRFDQWGRVAGEGQAHTIIVNQWLDHDYFKRQGPKSLDRNAFDMMTIDRLSLADGAATLAAFSARAIAKALKDYQVKTVFVSGGGAHNRTMMRFLENASGIKPRFMDELGLDGDFIEAYAFAYLSARIDKGLPLTFPTTTGVKMPLIGGKIAHP